MLISFVTVPAAAFVYSKTTTKEYSATASLLFSDFSTADPQVQGQNPSVSEDPTRAAATDLGLVSLRTVADLTAQQLHDGLAAAEVAGEVTASAEAQSNLVGVTATDRNPARAALIATTFAREFIAFRRQSDRAPLVQARARVLQELASLPLDQRNGARGTALTRQADQLAELASLQTGNVQLVQSAVAPTSPSSPRTFRNVVIGAFLGLLLAILAALVAERLDRNLKDSEEVDELFDRPALGVIPRFRPQESGHAPTHFRWEAEPFRMLRASLRYFEVGTPVRSILLTSPQRGDGKSTVARELALVAAERERVLLVEADLRRPTLSSAWGLPSSPGLSAVLAGRVSLENAIVRLSATQSSIATENGSDPPAPTSNLDAGLHVLAAGRMPPNPSDLLASGAMQDLLSHAEATYDLVVTDSPPLILVSDSLPLAKQVSGVVVVVRLRKTQREASRRQAPTD